MFQKKAHQVSEEKVRPVNQRDLVLKIAQKWLKFPFSGIYTVV